MSDGKRVSLTAEEKARYARHLTLPDVGLEGQERLKAASVLCIGAGGLGSPLALYLAAAGVGRLGIVDADRVEASNLQRQIIHGVSDVGRKKTESAGERLAEVNPFCEVELHDVTFKAENAMALAEGYDIIIDGTDNFPTRYLSNDVAFFQKKPNIYGSIFQFEGQVSVFSPGTGGPCYRCMFPVPPKPGMVPSCAEGGVFGVLPGIVGSLQATEAIKWILGIGQPLTGRLIHLDTLTMKIRSFELRKDPQCPLCGDDPTVTELVDYDAFCGLPKEGDASTVPVVTPAELDRALRAKEVVLIDVRETFEWDIARIEGAILIPLGELGARTKEIPRDRRIVLHCKSGVRSEKALNLLGENGFENLSHLEGGIDAWSKEVDGSVPRY